MYPDQNQYSIDYLNQIAPQAPKKGLSGRLRYILLGLGIAVVLTIGLVIFSALTAPKTGPVEHLAARLQSTQTIVNGAQINLKDGQLRSLNSNLSIYLTNTNRDIATPLKNNGIVMSKLSKSITTQENGAAMAARLDDARLNAVYDRTYAREMSYQLETLLILMQQVYTTTKSTSLKSFLESAYQNLTPIQKNFSDFIAASA